MYDVIVVGGGAIGASTAWRIAQTGRHVLLLERGHVGGEASGAAAGMLGAQLEVDSPGPFYKLCLESRGLYRDFAAELLEETGIDIQLVKTGILRLAYSDRDVAHLRHQQSWQTEHGGTAEWWEPNQIQVAEPLLSPAYGALYLPEDHNLNARMLTGALQAAAAKRCTLITGASVTSIEPHGTSVTVHTQSDTYTAEHVVISAGSWVSPLARPFGITDDVLPVKGQMLSIRPQGGIRLTHTVFTEQAYLVPKRDGTIIVGATEEHGAGYNRDVTAKAIHHLLSALHNIAPSLADAVFDRAWYGLRPKSAAGYPVIGRTPAASRVLVAQGHFRNGILLAPVTARMLVAALDEQPWTDTWKAFLPKAANVVR